MCVWNVKWVAAKGRSASRKNPCKVACRALANIFLNFFGNFLQATVEYLIMHTAGPRIGLRISRLYQYWICHICDIMWLTKKVMLWFMFEYLQITDYHQIHTVDSLFWIFWCALVQITDDNKFRLASARQHPANGWRKTKILNHI